MTIAAKPAGAKKAASALSPELIEANLKYRAKAALAADESPCRKHDAVRVHGARAPPTERLLSKHEVLAIVGCSYPSLWSWMRAGKFPRSRIVFGKSMWLASEVRAWIAELPKRPLKGDAEEAV